MSICLDYNNKVWCVVLDCTNQVLYMSISLQQCKDNYPNAVFLLKR